MVASHQQDSGSLTISDLCDGDLQLRPAAEVVGVGDGEGTPLLTLFLVVDAGMDGGYGHEIEFGINSIPRRHGL